MNLGRILASLLVIGVVGGAGVAASSAFFTDTETAEGNTFTAGELDIRLLEQNTNNDFDEEVVISNWVPGGTAIVNFDVLNDGTVPVNLRGAAVGTWNNTALDNNMVRVVKVERWNNGGWETVLENTGGITGYFYYGENGDQGLLYEVAPDTRAQLQVTVEFDESADNKYQGAVFTAGLQVDAKQLNATTWEE